MIGDLGIMVPIQAIVDPQFRKQNSIRSTNPRFATDTLLAGSDLCICGSYDCVAPSAKCSRRHLHETVAACSSSNRRPAQHSQQGPSKPDSGASTQATLTPTLPPSAAPPGPGQAHEPFSHLVQITGIHEKVEIMNSLMKPKKVWFLCVFHIVTIYCTLYTIE